MRISLIANIQPPKAVAGGRWPVTSQYNLSSNWPPATGHWPLPSLLVPRLLLLPVAGHGARRETCVAAVAQHAAHVGHAHHPRGAAHQPALDAAAASSSAEHAGARELLHHLTHLDVLLDERVDLRHRCAGAARDAASSARVKDAVVAALLLRHRVNDRLCALQLPLHLRRLLLVQLRHADAAQELVGQELHDLRERAEPLDLSELASEVVQSELVLLKFF